MLSQPLLSFPSAVPLGGEGLSGGLPPRLPSPKGKDEATCTQGIVPCGLHRAGLSAARVAGRRAFLTLPVLPPPGTAKALSGEGAEGLGAPGPPNAA